ncbi:MAG: serine hydrolase [Pseudomonadota bacterium]
MMFRAFAWIALLLLAAPAIAQPAPAAAPQAAEPLKARIAQLPAILAGAADYDAYFSAEFRAQVPKAQVMAINAQLAAAGGPVTGVEAVTPLSLWTANFTLGFRDGVGAVWIAVDPAAPNRVTGLRFLGFTAREATLDAVAASLRALPGQTGFAYARLGDGAPRLLMSDHEDRPFAIGSAFKLVILAELVRATNAGERKWTDTVTLDGITALPGGAYTLSPAGTQVTLRDLAAKMISVSDNSATDILLATLGRTRVEAMLPVLGIANPAALRPFIGTLDMFKLKGIRGGELAAQWLALDEAGRRAMLDGQLAREPVLAILPTLFSDGKPILIDKVEWFETPADLVRVMDWLRRNTAGGPGAEARAILSINPGIARPAAGRWAWVGYKGGSEPGVINMTLLLQGKDQAWYVITASWNNTEAAIDEARFAGLVSKAAELAAP